MRVCFVVLATVFTVLAVTDTALATVASSESKILLSSAGGAKVEGTGKRSLRSYDMSELNTKSEEERAVDPAAVIQKLTNADDIAAALNNLDGRMALFAKWFTHEDDIVAKLSEKTDGVMKNLPILLKFNDFRTSMHFNQALTKWLDTKKLDDLTTALQASKTKPMREQFTTWYRSGISSKEFSAVIAMVENPVKRKGYGALENHYKMFVQGEAKQTAAAAVKKTQEFAAKKAAAKRIAEAAAKRATELKAKRAANAAAAV
ncbi:hypothetical protein PHYPSEUDO_003214 [Phytophthora pseudosyringae]|uniref:RxLR effector protein n=1 Tax=Phytophthora pseudosyringae TaxID=221518 RepID=A0A8T1VRY9_9STRA|nr:hypothetical protein PHYPSEUDO_003214 [Phytophthora pseudosyringae]